ncbi:hypothetical protein JANAI62_17380 [Jannaschia pagri]|uniref:Lipoprotein n=1 Tax=Jannaschia pagri TaxID=2829797 RepID=A0ABQ4NLK4_9RHOB|nr:MULTISPECIES: hypothetical protein [unclassified Jannaschia]GIT91282.1 hypothetical protein JANAI61_17400 [Jannaschia sp. AI_61]GIT95115.1 hypothetical protein JANAI62_17380 [Jannaschia sp. AI_62]
MIRIAAFLPLVLIACGPPAPITPERAERLCRSEAEQADGISGSIGVGIGSDGPSARGGITITDDIFNPRPRDEALADCIARRTAGEPTPTTVGITIGGRT